MGYGVELKCNHCDFEGRYLLGIGRMFPLVVREVEQDIRRGKYGEEWQRFFEENPGAAVNIQKELYQCPDCNELKQDYNLSLYLPKDGSPETRELLVFNPGEYGKYVKSFVHQCPKCGARMHQIEDRDFLHLPCPKCGETLEMDNSMLWD